ncbi:MAG TPA: CBS domain-containing protein [Candidatus Nanoarchaeia archaeon]|nr:CBS domain-containing protein [Candidatus Nanoarchaeia archaeon]
MKTGITVGDAMSHNPVIISSSKSVKDCAALMVKKEVGSVLVKDGDRLLGIVTEKDIVHKVVAMKLKPEKTSVSDIMTTKVVTIKPDQDLYEVMVEMAERKIRRLPVLHNGKIIGMLTVRDILKIEPELFDLLVERYRAGQHVPLL